MKHGSEPKFVQCDDAGGEVSRLNSESGINFSIRDLAQRFAQNVRIEQYHDRGYFFSFFL